jgi:phage baseplate assembly protein W
MDGVNAADGTRLGGVDHLRQSIQDILTTPIGTRVMRRDYGSRLYRLVDAPLNRGTLLQLYAATAQAIRKWEPRFKLTKVRIASAEPGRVELDLTGNYLPDGAAVTIDGIVVN